MQPVTHPVLKDVVLIGAGHAHVTVLRMFAMTPLPGARFTLVTREVHSPYSGMLPGLIAGHYQFDDAHIDTGPLARFAGARLYQDEVVGLDLAKRQVICRHRPPVPYDLVSINIGSTPNTAQIPGAGEHAVAVKPIDGFLGRFTAMKERVIARKGRACIAVVGAGAGGVELLLSVAHRLRREVAAAGLGSGALAFVLVTEAADILPTFPHAFRAAFRDILAARGIAKANVSIDELSVGVEYVGAGHARHLILRGKRPGRVIDDLETGRYLAHRRARLARGHDRCGAAAPRAGHRPPPAHEPGHRGHRLSTDTGPLDLHPLPRRVRRAGGGEPQRGVPAHG
jgi:hypothetical protein